MSLLPSSRAALPLAASLSAIAASMAPASADDARLAALALSVDDRIIVEDRRRDYGAGAAAATKTPIHLVDTPQSVTLFGEDLLEDQAVRSLSEIARYVPGLQFGQGEGHRDAPTIRGNASTADFYVDGVRDDVQYLRDPYNAERLEILKGPNALLFGRGGGGGVINRVSKRAEFDDDFAELTAMGGTYGFARTAVDANAMVGEAAALRLNALYENAGSYRDFVDVEKVGFNPSAAVRLGSRTKVRAAYEYFLDRRVVDRGVPSRNGRPFDGDRDAFFGSPDLNDAETEVNLFNVSIEHALAEGATLRNRTIFADYNKYYSNVHANSPVNAAGEIALQSYFSTTDRENFFSQTDLIWETETGRLRHTILAGFEIGDQDTVNFRTENNNAVGIVTIDDPVFTGAPAFAAPRTNNEARLFTASTYVQDQIGLTPWLDVVAGVRFDHFDLTVEDRPAGGPALSRTDNRVSPRAGVVLKPRDNASIYVSYTYSFLPQSGDQFGALSPTTAALEPEKFRNIEVGVKVDLTGALAFTAALYQLDRTNTRAVDPATNLTVLTGEQRSRGFEMTLAGAVTDRWSVLGGYSLQDAEISSDTSAAPAGRDIPLVPRHEFSVWSRYDLNDRIGLAVGLNHRSETFASISNAVALPAYTRADAAVYFAVSDRLDLQINVENVFNALYFPTAHNDNNITPGGPRSALVTLRTRI